MFGQTGFHHQGLDAPSAPVEGQSQSVKQRCLEHVEEGARGLGLNLGKTTLPAELLQGDLLEEEDALNRTISTDPLPEECLS